MKRSKMFTPVALAASSLLLIAVSARAENISGTITTTRVITENSQLVGDVTCMVQGASCIQFGASGITLNLNGFTMTGLADPNTGCAGTPVGGENGINTGRPERSNDSGARAGSEVSQSGHPTQWRQQGTGGAGYGIEQLRFRPYSTGGSGDNHVEANVFTRNGNAGIPCGGICIAATSRNRIFRNQTSGNGYTDQSGVVGDDFGIGIVSPASTGNMIEENSALGNSNGISLVAGISGNVIRRKRGDGQSSNTGLKQLAHEYGR